MEFPRTIESCHEMIRKLTEENATLRKSGDDFGRLAERLNAALQDERRRRIGYGPGPQPVRLSLRTSETSVREDAARRRPLATGHEGQAVACAPRYGRPALVSSSAPGLRPASAAVSMKLVIPLALLAALVALALLAPAPVTPAPALAADQMQVARCDRRDRSGRRTLGKHDVLPRHRQGAEPAGRGRVRRHGVGSGARASPGSCHRDPRHRRRRRPRAAGLRGDGQRAGTPRRGRREGRRADHEAARRRLVDREDVAADGDRSASSAGPVFTITLKLIVPSPVPTPPMITESQLALLVAVQEQLLFALTATVPVPPPAPNDCDSGDRLTESPGADWLIVNDWPAIDSVADRAGFVGFAATL